MTANAFVQCAFYLAALTLLAVPLGEFMARVFGGKSRRSRRLFGPIENGLYRMGGVRVEKDMSWKTYALSALAFNLAGMLAVYALQRFQGLLPLNPAGFAGVPAWLAFNTAVSFTTNTNWQAYGGETTLSHLTQMLALTVQNFVSAATGMAVLAALVRGFVRREAAGIGNFWVDLVRTTVYVLMPLSLIVAIVLVSQGVVQTFHGAETVQLVQPIAAAGAEPVTTQTLAVGPAASQVAIKQLGTNGGGFFNVNSSHPFENATPLSNLVELLAILLIGGALCFTVGAMVRDRRQGWVLYAAMMLIFVPLLYGCVVSEQQANPILVSLGADANPGELQSGGNMEGKEVRFGIANSALWATATTAASNGSVNSMHDSFMPLGGLVPIWLMQLGEVVFGGVGSGLYGMLMFAVIAVFIAGLMVGRTPEYLGKKIEAFEMKMASIVVLAPVFGVLAGTALAAATQAGRSSVANPGAHGFSEVLYAFSSASNNNGSAFAGLNAATDFYTIALGVCMMIGRYWTMIPVLALAGSMARKKTVPASAGTMPTHTPLFVILLVGTVLLVGALTFVPALVLGPVVEHLQLFAR
jgi:K+-transporting ATPase ATPase A chain